MAEFGEQEVADQPKKVKEKLIKIPFPIQS
jgi:hypothetical protein